MKTSNQVRKDNSTSRTARQTRINKDFSLPPGDVHHSCLCFYDRDSQRPVTRIPITEDEFCAVLLVQYEPGKFNDVRAGEFIASAIREKLESAKQQGDSDNLDGAINQAEALSALMNHQFLHPGDGGEYNDSIKCGLVELTSETFCRLRLASEGAFPVKGGAR